MKKNTQNSSEELKNIVLKTMIDKKASEIVELDLRNLEDTVADYFIVCHANSTTQVTAIAEAIYQDVKKTLGILSKGQEGKANAQWVILDYFDIVVHVFLKETREYYQLEELWSDAVTIEHE